MFFFLLLFFFLLFFLLFLIFVAYFFLSPTSTQEVRYFSKDEIKMSRTNKSRISRRGYARRDPSTPDVFRDPRSSAPPPPPAPPKKHEMVQPKKISLAPGAGLRPLGLISMAFGVLFLCFFFAGLLCGHDNSLPEVRGTFCHFWGIFVGF